MASLTTFSALMVLFVAAQSYGEEIKRKEIGKNEKILTEKQIESCRNESNYRGDFNENKPTQELKCFLACAMVKLDLMDEKNGTLNAENIVKIVMEEGRDALKNFKTEVLQPCIEEVEVIADHCQLAYEYIMCGVKKTSQMKFH